MPRICEFSGIEIYMYHSEHAPPHFHALYAEFEAEFEIGRPSKVDGFIPPRQRRLVQRWARLHADELMANWNSARNFAPLTRIEPLA